MLQLEKLRGLCNSAHSGVTSVKKQIHLALEPSFLSNINLGICKCLNSHLQEYYPEVSGILLGYDNIKLKKSTGSMYNDQPHIHIDIQATFYIFCPSPATCLLGIVNKISQGHVGVLVHDTFNASILKPADVPVKNWAGSKLVVGKVVKFKVVSVSYSMNRLVLLGELDSLSMVVGEREVMVGIIEQVSDFEGDSDHDSGIENGHKRKLKDLPVAATAQVNVDTSGASGSKRKAEEEVEDEGERKKRKKAEKKARKEKERMEGEKTLEASNNVDSSDEFQTASNLTKKEEKISEDSNFSSSILESDLKHPKTPKAKAKCNMLTPKTPNTPKTPKDTFELPANFKVVEHKTEKNSWKSYQGPDGKNFRSMAEVKKHLAKVNSHLESSSNLVDTIEFVATEWNSTEHGDPAINVKICDLTDVKDFPKTDLYFVDMKPKPSAAKKASSDLTKVKEASAVDTTDTNIPQDEEVAESSKHGDDSNLKKKKKKKNKK
eukprot:TRINITY_DN13338_c0_g2_i4.p1 TRINITY_DN13338_c0_g2~~TRINITY_DN13338_c0_g2_i4.p1  ORF type:complete len:491 (+),score=166.86 TRINITY_DN13338_c0_g2_i4:41-1513(+)